MKRSIGYAVLVALGLVLVWSTWSTRQELQRALTNSQAKDTTITRLQTQAVALQHTADSLRKERQRVDTVWRKAKARVDTVLDPTSGATLEEVRQACRVAIDLSTTQLSTCDQETNRLRELNAKSDSINAVLTFDRDTLRNHIETVLNKPPSLPSVPNFTAKVKKVGIIAGVLAVIYSAFRLGQLVR